MKLLEAKVVPVSDRPSYRPVVRLDIEVTNNAEAEEVVAFFLRVISEENETITRAMKRELGVVDLERQLQAQLVAMDEALESGSTILPGMRPCPNCTKLTIVELSVCEATSGRPAFCCWCGKSFAETTHLHAPPPPTHWLSDLREEVERSQEP